MSGSGKKPIEDWSRIRGATGTVMAPQISSIHFRRTLAEALDGDQCADMCPNPAEVVLKEVPATLVTRDGERVSLPKEIDTQHLETTLAHLHLKPEQIRFLANSRKRLALCLECARKRISEISNK